MTSVPPIQEVRPGLFLIHWSEENKTECGEHKFQLRKCDYFCYKLVVEQSQINNEGLSLSLVKHFFKKIPTQSADTSPTEVYKATKNPDEQPLYVWIIQDGSKPIHLALKRNIKRFPDTTKTWGPVECSSWKHLELWLDFGTGVTGELETLNRWAGILVRQDFTDVVFNVKGEKMGGHSSILIASGPELASLFQKKGKRSTKTVRIDDVEPQVFQQILHYIYTGRAPLLQEEGMAEPLYVAAKKYGLNSLKDECARCLLARLSVENVADVVSWSHKQSEMSLYDGAIDYAARNMTEVSTLSNWKELVKELPEIAQVSSK